jgi:hypothetical protein
LSRSYQVQVQIVFGDECLYACFSRGQPQCIGSIRVRADQDHAQGLAPGLAPRRTHQPVFSGQHLVHRGEVWTEGTLLRFGLRVTGYAHNVHRGAFQQLAQEPAE